MNSFDITGEEKFVIYGASFLGKKLYESLHRNQIRVTAFLDRRVQTAWSVYASEHGFQKESGDRNISDRYEGVPVYHPDAAPEADDSTVIIIAITNVYEHPIIADILYTMGYRKILCQFPKRERVNQDKEINHRLYEEILNGNSPVGKPMSVYEPMLLGETGLTDVAEMTDQESCVIQIPMELLFYVDKNGKKRSVYMEDEILPFYHFLEGRDGRDFLELRDRIQKSGVNVNRFMETNAVNYYQMSLEWEDRKGDREDIPLVEKADNGCFLVKSHLEQVIFGVAKSYHRIDCKLSISDLENWNKPETIKQVLQIIIKQRISSVYTPILYPAFYWFQYRRESSGHTRLMRICRYFVEKGISVEGLNVLDAGAYVGYFAQHMYRMGAKVTAVEFDENNYELMAAINRLIETDHIRTLNMGIQDMDETETYDISILLTVLYWHFDTELGLQLMQKMDRVTKGILVWESGDEAEREKQWIFEHSSFNAYEKISDTFGTQKLREMGVFYRV